MVFSNDWTYLAVVKEKIELWDIDGRKLRELMEYPPLDPTTKSSSIIYNLKFSPNNHILAGIRTDDENSIIRFWDTRTGAILREIKVPFYIYSMAFNPDDKRLAVTGYGIIYVFGINPSP